MAANRAPLRLQSLVQRPNRDGQTVSPSLSPTRRGTTPTSVHPAVPTHEQL